MAPKLGREHYHKLLNSKVDSVKKWSQNVHKQARGGHFNFTGLPFELRRQILEESLLVDGPINPYPVAFSNTPKVSPGQDMPNVALLRVSKSVHREAAAVLYGENAFILNQDDPAKLPLQPLWESMLALPPRPGLRLGTLIIPFDTIGVSTPGSDYYLEVIKTWVRKINILDRVMQDWPIRQRLVLDFTRCECARGCRLVDNVVGVPGWYGKWGERGHHCGICRLEGPRNAQEDQSTGNRLELEFLMEAVRPVFRGLADEAEVEMLKMHGFVGTYEFDVATRSNCRNHGGPNGGPSDTDGFREGFFGPVDAPLRQCCSAFWDGSSADCFDVEVDP
ncbi:MAG: hypothetical protein Q9174_001802 [Haloplaca sp. 1 TL-2023]